jgi:hypothetical protein
MILESELSPSNLFEAKQSKHPAATQAQENSIEQKALSQRRQFRKQIRMLAPVFRENPLSFRVRRDARE